MGVQRLPVVTGPPKALEPGSYLTPPGLGRVVSVTVPEGWFGGAAAGGFSVGQGLDEANERFADAGLYVDVIPTPYGEAVTAFEELGGISHGSDPTIGTVDGHGSTTFRAHADGAPVVLDPIAPGLDLTSEAGEQIFIDVAGVTILVRTEVFNEDAQAALDTVVASIRFPED